MMQLSLSDLTVHRVVELTSRFMPALEMLPGLSPEVLAENRHWLQPDSLDPDDVFKLCYQSYVVQTPHHNILIDSCLGNDKQRARSEWHMKSDQTYTTALAKTGLSVDDIDYVMCTHLHADHVGWNTRQLDGRWVPTFPHARYIFGKREFDACKEGHDAKENPVYLDSVLPILDAGRADLVGQDFQLDDHVRVMPTPGHTHGHLAICIGRHRDHLVMPGDMIHVPIQTRYPELSFVRDKDPALAAVTRRAFLERYCETETLCCTAHFPSPSIGRIERWGDGYRLVAPR